MEPSIIGTFSYVASCDPYCICTCGWLVVNVVLLPLIAAHGACLSLIWNDHKKQYV